MFYLLFRHIFSEVTKIDLYKHDKLKTDPNKLILTKEVCDEMLTTGFKDNNDLIEAVRKLSGPEIEQNSYIEYHVFMKMIIEALKGNTTADPHDILNNLVFATTTDKHQPAVETDEIKPVFEDFDSIQNPETSNFKKDLAFPSPVKPSVSFNYNDKSPVKPHGQNSTRKPQSSTDKGNRLLASVSKKAGPNNGQAGEFYIGTVENLQSEIELYFRGQFT